MGGLGSLAPSGRRFLEFLVPVVAFLNLEYRETIHACRDMSFEDSSLLIDLLLALKVHGIYSEPARLQVVGGSIALTPCKAIQIRS